MQTSPFYQECLRELESVRNFIASMDSHTSSPIIARSLILRKIESLYEKLLLMSPDNSLKEELQPGTEPDAGMLGEDPGDQNRHPDVSVSPEKSILSHSHEGGTDTGQGFYLSPPVPDISRAIGLNDRFLFTRELFGNNPELYLKTIREVNECGSYSAALDYLQQQFTWDQESEVVISFLSLIRRRYS